jgi:hypothetical protein
MFTGITTHAGSGAGDLHAADQPALADLGGARRTINLSKLPGSAAACGANTTVAAAASGTGILGGRRHR